MARTPTRGNIALSPSGNEYRGEFALTSPPSDPAIVLCWDQANEDWVPCEITGGAGGAVPPLSTVFYVDSGTAVAPADQDGSIGKPYSDLQEAIGVKASADFTNTLLIVPRPDSYGLISVGDGLGITLEGLGGPAQVRTQVGAVNVGAGSTLGMHGMVSDDIVVGVAGFLNLTGEFETGTISGGNAFTLNAVGVTSASDGNVISSIAGIAQDDEVSSCIAYLNSVVLIGPVFLAANSEIYNCFPEGNVAATGDFKIDLFSTTFAHDGGSTITASGNPTIVDALTRTVTVNIDDVPESSDVQYFTKSFPGAKPGDSFAVALEASTVDPPAGIMYGAPLCTADDSIEIPVTIFSSATPSSIDLAITRFSVNGLHST